MSYGKLPKVSSRPRGVSEGKTRENPGEEKGAGNYIPYTSRYVTSYKVISGDIISGNLTSGDVTAPIHTSSSNARPIQHDILLTIYIGMHDMNVHLPYIICSVYLRPQKCSKARLV